MNKDELIKYGLAAIVGVAVVVYAKNKLGEVGTAINPMNQDNVINKAFTSLYQDITGSKSGSIGVDIYDFLHDKNGTSKLNPMSEGSLAEYGFSKGVEWGLQFRNFLSKSSPF